MSKKPKNFGYKNEHHLIEERVPPVEIIKLRELLSLPINKDIFDAGIKGANFEECLGRIAAHLDIVLDGEYDVPDLCAMLCTAITNRHISPNQPHLSAPGLKNVEIVERAKDITIEELASDIGTIAPVKGSRYTICDKCETSFDCISEKSCRLGKPAVQLDELKRRLH